MWKFIETMNVIVLFCLFLCYRRYRFYASSLKNKTLLVVSDPYACQRAVLDLRRKCEKYRVLGFDCEWPPSSRDVQNPVALLQFATKDGHCVLIRLCKFRHSTPRDLESLLADPSILKVGVAACEDATKLYNDYGWTVNGCLDLRHLMLQNGGVPKGLEYLAKSVLGVTLPKDKNQLSNWEAPSLSESQVNYAADDVLVAVKIFDVLAKGYLTLPGFFTWLLNIFNSEPDWVRCYQWSNVQFRNKNY